MASDNDKTSGNQNSDGSLKSNKKQESSGNVGEFIVDNLNLNYTFIYEDIFTTLKVSFYRYKFCFGSRCKFYKIYVE